MAPIETTGVLIVEKHNSHASSLCSGPCSYFSIVPREIDNLCVSSLRQSHENFWSRNFRNAWRPSSCFAVMKKKKKHARSFHQYLHTRIMRVILAQGSCPMLQILDVSSQRKETGAMLLFFQKQKYVRVILAQSAMQIFSAQKKKRATDSI